MAQLTSSDLAKTFKSLRQASGTNQQGIAELLKIDQAGISRIENNQQPPTAEQIIVLSNYYNISIENFFQGTINLWDVAIRFNNLKWLPKRYTQYRVMRAREIQPLLGLISNKLGLEPFENILKEKKLHLLLHLKGNELISTFCAIDLMKMIEAGEFPSINLHDLSLCYKNAIEHRLYLNGILDPKDDAQTLFSKWLSLSDQFSGMFFFDLVEKDHHKFTIEWGLNESLSPVRLKIGRYKDFFREFYLSLMSNIPNINNYPAFNVEIIEDFKRSFGKKQIIQLSF